MAPTLYMLAPSPPVRAVQITAKALGIQFQEETVDTTIGEQLKPEYLKINPQHTVPTFVEDDGFTLWDSHAIMAYLVSKYGKNDSLYPKDLRKRALVDQRLHFDTGVGFSAVIQVVRPIMREGKKKLDDKDKETVNQVYEFLEAFLDGKSWVAGDAKTIADYSVYSTITALDVFFPIDGQKYGEVVAWLKRVDALPEVEVSKKGLRAFETLIKSRL